MKRGAAVVLDCDGTLIPKEPFTSLFNVIDSNGGVSLGCYERAKEMRKHYLALAYAGKLTERCQRKWFSETIKLYVVSGLAMKKIGEILESVRLRPGVKEILRELHTRGVPVAIVSYGIVQFIESVLLVNGMRHYVDAIYAANLRVDASGLVTGFHPRSAVYPFNKGYFSRQFADLHRVPYRNLLAVGDSPNGDCGLGHFKKNRFGIARDESERKRLLKVMGAAAVTESFDPAADWLRMKLADIMQEPARDERVACANPLCGKNEKTCPDCGNSLPKPMKVGN
ncbi:MAG: haloacid dehalogenase-like hydrolase [Patescibacteria group bacterium]|nr:haloacid dehalogenase-like hydrolase [Patescibacteria group bacterium]